VQFDTTNGDGNGSLKAGTAALKEMWMMDDGMELE
jgi:hypothetical protein